MNKNYRDSLRKWDAGLWERLKKYKKNNPQFMKGTIFDNILWTPCGFCKEFGCSKPKRDDMICPLRTDKLCCPIQNDLEDSGPIPQMKIAWKKGDKRMFERHRKKFYEIMKSHKDKFRKEIK